MLVSDDLLVFFRRTHLNTCFVCMLVAFLCALYAWMIKAWDSNGKFLVIFDLLSNFGMSSDVMMRDKKRHLATKCFFSYSLVKPKI